MKNVVVTCIRTVFVADKYKLPPKYIRGLEKAPKLPKKKT